MLRIDIIHHENELMILLRSDAKMSYVWLLRSEMNGCNHSAPYDTEIIVGFCFYGRK